MFNNRINSVYEIIKRHEFNKRPNSMHQINHTKTNLKIYKFMFPN